MLPVFRRFSVFWCVIIIASAATALGAQQNVPVEGSSEGDVRLLLSGDVKVRDEVAGRLGGQYVRTRFAIQAALGQSVDDHQGDRRYASPLHSTILAADAWRVFEAENSLLSVVDYELDRKTLPVGITVGGDFFYPAAGALVRMRIDTVKVVEAIKSSKTPKRLRILTWMLVQRTERIEEAKGLLQDAAKASSEAAKQNLKQALEFLQRPNDLLALQDLVAPQ